MIDFTSHKPQIIAKKNDIIKLPGLRVDVNKCQLNLNCNLMYAQRANFNISFCNNSIKFSLMILIFAGYIHLCLKNILHELYFSKSFFFR